MAKGKSRKPISNTTRFEVFKRDSFTCVYCGSKAPNVILHIDHVKPVAKGGESDIFNYVTACASCNSGKGARELSDSSAVSIQMAHLEELEARQQQLSMIVQWKESFRESQDIQIQSVLRRFTDLTGYELLFDSLIESFTKYVEYDTDGVSFESAKKIFSKMFVLANIKAYPIESKKKYIFVICRNKFGDSNAITLSKKFDKCFFRGVSYDVLIELAKEAKEYKIFNNTIDEILESNKPDATDDIVWPF